MSRRTLSVMEHDAAQQRSGKPFVFTDAKHNQSIEEVIGLVKDLGGL